MNAERRIRYAVIAGIAAWFLASASTGASESCQERAAADIETGPVCAAVVGD